MALRTALCDLVGIQTPIIQAGMSIFAPAELAAAVSNAGGLGSLGVWQRSIADLEESLQALRESTDKPFALNHVVPDVDEAAFELSLRASPAVMAFALDDAGALVERVHDAGSLAMQQVCTVEQAERAAANGVDIIIAQGSESGGYGGAVSTLALVPQVVDAVHPIPVVAAGGIADGRGIVAALSLGAAGVNLGTRFLATTESPVGPLFRRRIVESRSEDWRQFEFQNAIRPNPGTVGYGTKLRMFVNEFTLMSEERYRLGSLDLAGVRDELNQAFDAGRLDELMVVAGQSAGLVSDVPPAGSVVRTLADEAERVLQKLEPLSG